MEILIFIIFVPFFMSSVALGCVIYGMLYLIAQHKEYQENILRGDSEDD